MAKKTVPLSKSSRHHKRPARAKPTALAKVADAVIDAATGAAAAAVQVAEAARDHVILPVAEAAEKHVVQPIGKAVGAIKPAKAKKARYLREKKSDRPAAKAVE